MSLTSCQPAEVVYNVDKSCEPIKVSLKFRDPLPASSEEVKKCDDLKTFNSILKPAVATPSSSTNVQKLKVQKTSKSNEAQRLKEEENQIADEKLKKKRENIQRRKEEFFDKGIMTALYGAVQLKVQSALLSTDHVLAEKRTRLRELLLAEEIAYTTEYVGMCQQANASREEEILARALELKQKNERERQELARLKLMEQKMLSCDAARPTFSKKQLMELKQNQLWQIREKYALKEAKREEERMYHDLMIKNIEAMKENEEEMARLAWKKQKDTQEAFVEQMKQKEQKERQERQLKEFERQQLEEELRLLKQEGEKEKEELRLKKERVKEEARKLVETAKAMKDRRKREEEAIDQTFSCLMKIEEEKERRKESSDKERLRREMDIFLEKNRELKLQKKEEERMFDQMIESFNEKKRQEKDAERRKLKAAKEELFQDVLRGREQQIREKQERERREAENEQREIELLEMQIEQQKKIRNEYERRCAQQREEYKCQLLRQIAEVEERKKRTKEEKDEYVRKQKEKEEKEIEEVKEMLKALPVGFKDHPFKSFVKDNPPKYPCLHPYLK